MTMSDHVWLCMTIYDYVWLCMIMYNYWVSFGNWPKVWFNYLGWKANYKLRQVSFSQLDTYILISSFKNICNHSAIIHIWRLQRCIIWEIWKIYWQLMIIISRISLQQKLGSSGNFMWWSITISWPQVWNFMKIHVQMGAHKL